jgi:hypothetical protein
MNGVDRNDAYIFILLYEIMLLAWVEIFMLRYVLDFFVFTMNLHRVGTGYSASLLPCTLFFFPSIREMTAD